MSDYDLKRLFEKWIELDRELKLLKQEVSDIKAWKNSSIKPIWLLSDGGIDYLNDKPAQWPNEPYTDYLKRIGEYNEAMIYEDESK